MCARSIEGVTLEIDGKVIEKYLFLFAKEI
jgi:hypothetical protein